MTETEQLKDALRVAINEIRAHNQEYQHITPDEMLERWEILIGDRAAYTACGEPD